jgi:hypothetical protein
VTAALLAFGARAQSPPSSPAAAMFPQSGSTPVWQLSGEPTSVGSAPPPGFVALPLRLSLLGSVFPSSAGIAGEDCAANAEAAGNTSFGFPVQHTAAVVLVPHLTLHGFARLGCPLDTALGGAVDYTVPLRRNLWLDLSTGILRQPGLPFPTPVRTESRVDLVLTRSSGRTFSVGVSARKAFNGVTFTGGW